jgi:predicted  nucleic acid-binding Zn-ribbon protein
MKINKKVILSVVGGIVGLGLAFGGGSYYTHATDDWQTTAENNASTQLDKAAKDKTTSLSQSVDSDINSAVSSKLSDQIAQQQAELQSLLQQYYDARISGITDSQKFKDLESRIQTLQNNLLGEYKGQIDQMFDAQ